MITNREAVANINKLLDTDFDPNEYDRVWSFYPSQFCISRRLNAKQVANKLLRYFGELAEEYLSAKGQYEIRIFIDNWAYRFVIADLLDSSTVILCSIWKTDKTLEEWKNEQ